VRSVLAKVELGEADAAFVYQTDARASRRVRVLPLPAGAGVRAEYPLAVVAASRQRAPAAAFARFVLSPAGQRVLRRFGFE
jgi:molybdate transport system substrate-binding protein